MTVRRVTGRRIEACDLPPPAERLYESYATAGNRIDFTGGMAEPFAQLGALGELSSIAASAFFTPRGHSRSINTRVQSSRAGGS